MGFWGVSLGEESDGIDRELKWGTLHLTPSNLGTTYCYGSKSTSACTISPRLPESSKVAATNAVIMHYVSSVFSRSASSISEPAQYTCLKHQTLLHEFSSNNIP